MINVKLPELDLEEKNSLERFQIPKILISPQAGAMTARTNDSVSTTNRTKVSPRPTAQLKHARSNSNFLSTKFTFHNEHDQSDLILNPSEKSIRFSNKKPSRGADLDLNLFRETSSKKRSKHVPYLRLEKSNQLQVDTMTLSNQALSMREGKHIRSISEITSLLTPRNESKADFFAKNTIGDASSLFTGLVKKIPETALIGIATPVTLKLFQKIVKQTAFDLNYEKTVLEYNIANQHLHQTAGYKKSTEYDLRVDYFKQQKRLIMRQYELFDKLLPIINQTLVSFTVLHSKSAFDEGLNKLVTLGREYHNSEIVLYCLKIWGKISRIRRDILKAEQLFKQHKQMCNIYRSFQNKISSYKHLGICAQDKLNHRVALSYFLKMLQIAWLVNNTEFELKSYDMIGLEYFYMNNLERANYYHTRSISGIKEPKDSEMRKLGINRALQKLPPDAQDYLAGKKNTAYWETNVQAHETNVNIYASSDEEIDFQMPTPFENNSKNEKRYKADQIRSQFHEIKAGKLLYKVKKETSIHKIFESDLIKEPSANFNVKLPNVVPKVTTVIGEGFMDIYPRIFVSHLSPNRGLQNFSKLNLVLASAEKHIVEDSFDSRTMLKAAYKLEKLTKNVEFAKEAFQKIVYHDSKLGFELEPINFGALSMKSKKNPRILIKKF